ALPFRRGALRRPGLPWTRAVGADAAAVDPNVLTPVTAKRRALPRSATVARYVAAVAPGIGAQPAPAALQRCQARVRAGAGTPSHAPATPDSTAPTRALPLIVGAAVATGTTPRFRATTPMTLVAP